MAVTLNTGVSAEDSGSSATLTISSVTTTGSNRVLLVRVSWDNHNADGSLSVSSIAWDAAGVNEALTKINHTENVDDGRVEFWYRTAPTAKTADVTITFDRGQTATCTRTAWARPLSDAEQSAGFAASYTGAIGNTGTMTVTVPSASGETVFDATFLEAGAVTVHASQTDEFSFYGTGDTRDGGAGYSYEVATGTSTVMSWTGTSDHWASAGISVEASALAVTPVVASDTAVVGLINAAQVVAVSLSGLTSLTIGIVEVFAVQVLVVRSESLSIGVLEVGLSPAAPLQGSDGLPIGLLEASTLVQITPQVRIYTATVAISGNSYSASPAISANVYSASPAISANVYSASPAISVNQASAVVAISGNQATESLVV